jgi:hypothetical protein
MTEINEKVEVIFEAKTGRTPAIYRDLFLYSKTLIEQNKQLYFLKTGTAWQAECRKTCDSRIRRWTHYAIKEDLICERANSYMYRAGDPNEPTTLEHVIPNSRAIEHYMNDNYDAIYLLFNPICKLGNDDAAKLNGSFAMGEEDFDRPFARYVKAGITSPIYTWDGRLIDPQIWTKENHFEFVIKPHPVWGALFTEFSK